MLFSVIIPTYNRRALLAEALASVWAQSFADYEVIVVDDGSTDGTRAWLQTLEDRVVVVAQPNSGQGAARNAGADRARGRYLAFLDSDDILFPSTLSTYAGVIRATGDPAFLAGCPWQFEGAATTTPGSAGSPQYRTFADYLASGDEWRWWGASSFVVRADAFRRQGGFRAERGENSEDADLALRLGEEPGFVQITAPPTFGYRRHAQSLVSDQAKSLKGAWLSIAAEARGGYPGGERRAYERRRILTRHLRPLALACLGTGRIGEAWSLYRATWRWHCAIGQWKFLLSFIPLMLAYRVRARL